MLIELRVRDYAVIDDLSLELRHGLNVLSGETGAGKSIIVGALSLLVGERASSQIVRKGAEKALVEGTFDLSNLPQVQRQLEDLGFPAEEGLLLLRREVAAEGRNRAWVNGSPATASVVGALGARLVDIHGQHEHQSLLARKAQREILDIYAGAAETARSVADTFADLKEKRAELDEKEARVADLEARAEFLRFQLSEIDEAKIQLGEDGALEAEAKRLDHVEELAKGARGLHESLYGGDDSLSDRVASLRGLLEHLSKLDPALGETVSTLEEAYHLLTDSGQKLGDYASGLEYDPVRLEEIRSRLDRISRLKRKYGPDLEEVLSTGARIRAELDELDEASLDLGGIRKEILGLEERFEGESKELGRIRAEGAKRLEAEVVTLFPDMGLGKGIFRIKLTPLEEPGSFGGEQTDFQVSLNPGFDPGPLSQIASGGELSRVMLALKSVLAGVDEIPSLIFDEIDAGIGGEIALKVAEKLHAVAHHHQVFVITHLPQLAARADQQLLVEKDEVEGMASTSVRVLAGEERIREVARMLGGDPESQASRDHARELLGFTG